jgi:uncharacterized protein YbcI
MASKTERPPGELLAAISNMVVQAHADHMGRGPTKARTYIHENIVTCLLEDTLTQAERTLLSTGRDSNVLEIRSALQETMRESLTSGMERLTERRVDVLVNGNNVDPDMISHVFVLGMTTGAPVEES